MIGAKEGKEAQVGKLLEKEDLRREKTWKRCESLRSGGEVTWREVGWSLQGWWEAKWAGGGFYILKGFKIWREWQKSINLKFFKRKSWTSGEME